MKLFPEIYIRASSDRLSVKSKGKLQADLTSWPVIPNLLEKAKDETTNETANMADGTTMTDCEKVVFEWSGIEMEVGDFAAVKAICNGKIDVLMFDQDVLQYNALYKAKATIKKTYENEKSVTFTFTVEKRCTNADRVTQFLSIPEAYITGIVTEASEPVPGAIITCIDPSKPSYSVVTDSHGEFAIEVTCDIDGYSNIRVAKDAKTKDVTLKLVPGDIIEDFEIVL